MAEHQASVVVSAPVELVFAMLIHFNDFPKVMRFVAELRENGDRGAAGRTRPERLQLHLS